MSVQRKISRRRLAALAAGAAAASAQTAPAPPATAPGGDDELNAARDRLKRNFEQLAKVDLPMSTEPAAHFRA